MTTKKSKLVKLYSLLKNHTMKVHLGNRGKAPSILNLWTRERRVISCTSQLHLPLGKRALGYLLDMRLGGPWSKCGHSGQEKTPSAFTRNHMSAVQFRARHFTELSWLMTEKTEEHFFLNQNINTH